MWRQPAALGPRSATWCVGLCTLRLHYLQWQSAPATCAGRCQASQAHRWPLWLQTDRVVCAERQGRDAGDDVGGGVKRLQGIAPAGSEGSSAPGRPGGHDDGQAQGIGTGDAEGCRWAAGSPAFLTASSRRCLESSACSTRACGLRLGHICGCGSPCQPGRLPCPASCWSPTLACTGRDRGDRLRAVSSAVIGMLGAPTIPAWPPGCTGRPSCSPGRTRTETCPRSSRQPAPHSCRCAVAGAVRCPGVLRSSRPLQGRCRDCRDHWNARFVSCVAD